MILIDTVKYACLECIRGHRLTLCRHHFRPLLQVRSKGRPIVLSANNQNYRVAVFAEEVADDPALDGTERACERTPVIILKASAKQVIDIESGRIVGPYDEKDFVKTVSTCRKPPVISDNSFVTNQVCCSKSLVPRPIDRVSKSCGCNRLRKLNKTKILQKYLTRKRMEEVAPTKQENFEFASDSRELDFGMEQVVFLSLGDHSTKNATQVKSGDGSQLFDVFQVPRCSIDGLCCCDYRCSCPGCEKHGNLLPTATHTMLPQPIWNDQTNTTGRLSGINFNGNDSSRYESHPLMPLSAADLYALPLAQSVGHDLSYHHAALEYPRNAMDSASILRTSPPTKSIDLLASGSNFRICHSTSQNPAIKSEHASAYIDSLHSNNTPPQLESDRQKFAAHPPSHSTALEVLEQLLEEQSAGAHLSEELEGCGDRLCQCPDNSCECMNCETHGNLNGYRLDDILNYEMPHTNAVPNANMLSEQTLRDLLMNDSHSSSPSRSSSEKHGHPVGARDSDSSAQPWTRVLALPQSESSCCSKRTLVEDSAKTLPFNMETPPFSGGIVHVDKKPPTNLSTQ